MICVIRVLSSFIPVAGNAVHSETTKAHTP